MRLPRALALTAIAATTAVAMSSVPAQAATLSPEVVAGAYSVMLTAPQATTVGIDKHYAANFVVASSTKGTPDAPYLCELSGGTSVKGQGAGSMFDSIYINLPGKDLVEVSHQIHSYASEQAAKKTYDAIVKKVKSCEGQQLGDASGTSGEVVDSIPTALTNGTKKAKDGDSFLWVNSQTIDADATASFADYDYTTVRHFGSFIQIMDLQSEGLNATPFTKKQIANLDKLTDSLGDAWQAKFS